MALLQKSTMSSCKGSFMGTTVFAPARQLPASQRATLQVTAGMKAVRDRIASVKNTGKITEAMKLVAAAKVRRAQAAVINGRPFSENLVKVLYGVNQRLRTEDVDSPLCQIRAVKSACMMVVTGDRGLCGGYNNFILKKTEARYKELKALGVEPQLVLVGRKGIAYFKRRPQFQVAASFALGQAPSTKEAQAIANTLYALFVSGEVQKVELIFTKFISLITSNPSVQTLLPLLPSGELCSIEGVCVDANDDEIFKLTTKSGKLTLERESKPIETEELDPSLIFEQEPAQILDALLPLYMNSTLLRVLQEALASELAARMNAMSSASDNSKDLRKRLNNAYNRVRQSKITQEISEIVAGANC